MAASRVFQAAVALAMLLVPLAALAQWESYLYETFDTTDTMFPTGTFGEATYSVDSQGRYIVNGMDSGVDSLSAINDSSSFYRMSADCQILSSSAGELAFTGILFHYGKRPGDEKPSYYVFYVYGDGFYGVKRIMSGGKSDIIIPLASTDLLTAGEPNTLAVEARGNRFELFINGQPVNSFTDVKIDSGGYGFYISKHSIGAFDEFEVEIEPTPVRSEAELNEGGRREGGYKPLDIPRNPNRPLYPWEVGYDKDPKKKKRRQQGDERSRDADVKPAPKKAPKKATKKPAPRKFDDDPVEDEMVRDADSRRSDGFVADQPSDSDSPSIREQYRESYSEEARPVMRPAKQAEEPMPEPDEKMVPEPTPAMEEPAEEEVAEPEPEQPGGEAPLRLDDETATDTGAELPGTDEDLLYKRAPEFEDKSEVEAQIDAANNPKPEDKETAATGKRRGGIKIDDDDWDSAPRTKYIPKRRLPPGVAGEQQEEAKPEPKPEPVKAIASDGRTVEMETVPLDGSPMEEEGAGEREPGAAVEEEPATLLAPEPEPEAEALTEPETVTEAPVEEIPLGEQPEAVLETEPEPVIEQPAARIGGVSISDDFTADTTRWNSRILPNSSYQYVEGGYAIDNTRAQTMAISYQQEDFADVEISVDAVHTAGADYVGYGLAGRFVLGTDAAGNPQISYYGLFISRSGELMLLKVVGGKETVLQDWSVNPLIELGALNRITLRIEGDRITALVNGRAAASVTDGDIASGGYALLAGPGVAARFDSLSLTGTRQ